MIKWVRWNVIGREEEYGVLHNDETKISKVGRVDKWGTKLYGPPVAVSTRGMNYQEVETDKVPDMIQESWSRWVRSGGR